MADTVPVLVIVIIRYNLAAERESDGIAMLTEVRVLNHPDRGTNHT